MAFNDNLDSLKKLVSDFAQAATSITKKAASATKTNISLITEQEKQKKAFLELGKLYYRDFITGEEPDDAEYLPLCDAITEATKNIEAMKESLEDMKSRIFGGKAEDAETEPVEEPVVEDPAAELENLHKELDELTEELHKLDGVVDPAPAAPVFEVVPEEPDDEPKDESPV